MPDFLVEDDCCRHQLSHDCACISHGVRRMVFRIELRGCLKRAGGLDHRLFDSRLGKRHRLRASLEDACVGQKGCCCTRRAIVWFCMTNASALQALMALWDSLQSSMTSGECPATQCRRNCGHLRRWLHRVALLPWLSQKCAARRYAARRALSPARV